MAAGCTSICFTTDEGFNRLVAADFVVCEVPEPALRGWPEVFDCDFFMCFAWRQFPQECEPTALVAARFFFGSSAECVGRKVLHRQFSSLSFGSANGSAPSFSPSHRPSVAGARPMRRRGERGSQVILKKWTTKMHSVGRCVIGGGVTNIINTPPDRTECS